MTHYPEHKEYQAATSKTVKKIAAGPLLSDDGEIMVGSCFILDVQSRKEAENFIFNDPFYIHGVWNKENISIQRYISLPNGISEYTN